jgi:hypothetical protein
MGKLKYIVPAIFALISLSVQTAWAANNNDIALTKEGVRFSSETFLEGSSYRIYCTVYNYSTNDLKGLVKFVDETAGRQIGSDQTATVFGSRTDDLFVEDSILFLLLSIRGMLKETNRPIMLYKKQ